MPVPTLHAKIKGVIKVHSSEPWPIASGIRIRDLFLVNRGV
jgi:hypothetical protein